jgi:hypothetical protein
MTHLICWPSCSGPGRLGTDLDQQTVVMTHQPTIHRLQQQLERLAEQWRG